MGDRIREGWEMGECNVENKISWRHITHPTNSTCLTRWQKYNLYLGLWEKNHIWLKLFNVIML